MRWFSTSNFPSRKANLSTGDVMCTLWKADSTRKIQLLTFFGSNEGRSGFRAMQDGAAACGCRAVGGSGFLIAVSAAFTAADAAANGVTDDTFADMEEILVQANYLKKGAVFISMASMPIQARQQTNMLKINVVT